MYTHMCVYIYTHTYTHTYIHISHPPSDFGLDGGRRTGRAGWVGGRIYYECLVVIIIIIIYYTIV